MFGATLEQLMLHTQMEQMRRDLIHQKRREISLTAKKLAFQYLERGKFRGSRPLLFQLHGCTRPDRNIFVEAGFVQIPAARKIVSETFLLCRMYTGFATAIIPTSPGLLASQWVCDLAYSVWQWDLNSCRPSC